MSKVEQRGGAAPTAEPELPRWRTICWRVESGRIPEQLDDCSDSTDDAAPTDPVAAEAPEVFTVTITDLARFAPRDVATVAEPFGVGVVGLPVNFVAPATVHEVPGTLFGQPLRVRFTPVEYVFEHGDGTRQGSRTAGRTWDDLGFPQFTATDTSYAYSARGTYSARAVVRYSADIDLGGGWVLVPGTLDIPTAEVTVRVYEVRNALVAHDCIEDPDGVGC
ncbi:hypothetical protein [Microbacterium sp.]|uniref:hypothetical protein n=1 Tax=Microbacterium sp. TaxID=51671 RepID=UPI003A857D23